MDVLPVEVSDCGRRCMHARQDIYHRQAYIPNVNGGYELKYSNIFYARQCLVSSAQSVSGERRLIIIILESYNSYRPPRGHEGNSKEYFPTNARQYEYYSELQTKPRP